MIASLAPRARSEQLAFAIDMALGRKEKWQASKLRSTWSRGVTFCHVSWRSQPSRPQQESPTLGWHLKLTGDEFEIFFSEASHATPKTLDAIFPC